MDSDPINVPEPGDADYKDLEAKEEGLGQAAYKAGLAVDRFPESFEEGEVAENLLIEEMQKLSLVEHEKVVFDVHGIATPIDESPEFVDEKIHEMQDCVSKIRKKKAYDLAKYMNEDFVSDRDFRIMFLRAEKFDPKLSAQRFLRHFEVKRQLFGDGEVLGRDVMLSDLSSDAMRALQSGFIQILPSRDAAGRSIFSIAPMHRPKDVSVINCTRALWYLFNTALKDEETQRKGVVGVNFNVGEKASIEPLSILKQIHYIRSGVPKRIVGLHYCYDDASMRPFVAGIRLFLDKEARNRFRTHFGDPENIEFELKTYGIPTQDHPVGPNGELSLAYHQEWLQIRQIQEEESQDGSSPGVLVPRKFDVLFGRGKNTREHTGNLRANHLVEMHQEEYERAGKFEKTKVANRIVTMIHESYGRFLKWETTGWVEVGDEVAREKISHFFRHLRSKATVPASGKDETKQVAKRVTPCPSPSFSLAEENFATKHARGLESD